MTKPPTFGSELRRLRMACERTLADVAEAIGKSIVYVSDVERGRRAPFQPDRVDFRALAEVLGTSATKLLKLAADSSGVIEINVGNLDEKSGELAVRLMRRVNDGSLSTEQMLEIQKILDQLAQARSGRKE